IVDDAYDFGRIAAANAFSDVYAMGATPLFALNLVGWPRDTLPYDLLGDVLRGGADVAREAGAFVLGGHSIDDPEPKYGMVVIGRGAVPGGTKRNRESLEREDAVSWRPGVPEVERVLLCDAQTSGGLLIALPERDVPALVAALEKEGTPAAAVIGRVVTGHPGTIAVT